MLSNQWAMRVAVTLGIAMAATACERPAGRDGPGLVNITKDPPNPVTCSDSTDIGPAGGSVVVSSLAHELEVRAGAVKDPPAGPGKVQFVIEVLDKPYVGVRAQHRGPPGTKFDPRLNLRLSYAGCEVPNEGNLRIYRWTRAGQNIPPGGDWVRLDDSSVDPSTKTVTVPLDSLSEYALGAT